MQPADIAACVAIDLAVNPSPWNAQMFADSLAQHHARVLENDGTVVGFVIWSVVLDEAEILNIAMCPEQQRRGLGGLLLDTALGELGGLANRVFLEVRASNFAAIGFYLHRGFAVVGERRDYYPTALGRENALVMQLDLETGNGY